MTTANYDALKVGDEIPSLTTEPVSRLTLALYATGSGDHHPLHLDQDYVRSKGIPDVFAHGMLGMAYLGRMLTQWVPQEAIRSFGVRFTAITQIGERMVCTGKVVEKLEQGGEKCVRLELTCANEQGEAKHKADAVVALA
ncbi:MAG: MaoC/PaaZ C-terminal domain-containing protein [Candidatus Accumulibacter phosphatis]|jgi:acyl dehydratase|uniref:(3R)-hydroxyacyl-ACP dehydratase subunit HadB n=2 Tax=Candidatus Accumulibacter TaxID=327159 RepID=A0A080LR67_9PROT|nr:MULTISPECIES: MaoC/PaaZ C-terminal domain-containing protein [Candidatus Accumulibacter]KFB70598.1 MAG: (3R)-hydroxyacyl-ACP dehydratase subunit HadB [Candidatus Accumulibacter phosphatis]MBL8407224.1 dehydratase [Accumulibacter sp.]NMQ04724.1 dehydratase [Candidatus Accumulibacter contiguus]HRF13248.1 MaoC/PaaZ C-terminal domain-containing protein [Candidatus Accumulibacter phosphatis]